MTYPYIQSYLNELKLYGYYKEVNKIIFIERKICKRNCIINKSHWNGKKETLEEIKWNLVLKILTVFT